MLRASVNLASDTAQDLWRSFFEESSDGLIIFEPQTLCVVNVNTAAGAMAATPASDLIGDAVGELFDPTDASNKFLHACRTATEFEFDNLLLKRCKANPINVGVAARRITIDQRSLGLIKLRTTHQSETTKTLPVNTSKSRVDRPTATEDWQLRQLIDGVNAIVWEADAKTWRFTFVNEEAEAMLGYPVSSWLTQPDFWVSLIHDDDRQTAVAFCQECTSLGRDHEFDYRVRKASGEFIWLRDIVRVITDDHGNPTTLRGVMVDIDATKCAQEELQESEAQRERTEEFALVMPVRVALDGRWTKVTPRLCEFLGYDEQELLGITCEQVTHPEDVSEDARQIATLLSGDIKSFDHEKRYIRKDGQTVWASINCSIAFDRNDQPVHFLTFIRDITERKKAEQALRESEQRYRNLVQNAPVCIHEIDRDGKIRSMNPAGLQMIAAQSEAAVLGVDYLDVVCESDRSRIKSLLKQALEGDSVYFDFPGIIDGNVRLFSSNLIPILSGGKVAKLVGVSEDVTDRLEMESKLRESEQRFRTIFEQAAVGVALIESTTGRFLRINRKYEQLIGYSTDEICALTFMDITSEGLETDLANMQRLRSGEISEFDMEKRLVRKDGSLMWAKLTVSPIWDSGEKLRHHIAIVEDISTRKKIEQNLRNSEASLAKAQEIAKVGNWSLDLASGVLTASAEAYRIVGTSDNDGTGRSFRSAIDELVLKEDQHTVLDAIRNVLANGQPSPIDFRVRNPESNAICFVRADAEMIRDTDGTVSGMFGTLQDITDQKFAELALRESENKFRVIAERSPAMVAIFQDGKIQYASEMVSSITGYSTEEALEIDFAEMIDPEYQEFVRDRNRRRMAGETVPSRYEFKLRTKTGERRWIDFSVGMMQYNGRPAVLGIALDITERRATEERLRQRESELAHVSRLTTMGEMVAGIAHEINQPLSAMSSFADACVVELAKIDDDRTSRIKNWAEQIGIQAVRCGDIITRLRQYVKQKQTDDARVQINEVIQNSIALMRDDVRKNLKVICDLKDPCRFVQGNSIEIQQVIVNLLANAHEATQQCERSRQTVTLRSAIEGDFLRIDVIDDGPGISSDILDRLYDAFFTTKTNGIGMGLAISRSIVERHNGHLWAENTRPHGATFHVELPLI